MLLKCYFCFISLNNRKGCNNVLRSNKHREQASHEDGEPGPGVHEDLLSGVTVSVQVRSLAPTESLFHAPSYDTSHCPPSTSYQGFINFDIDTQIIIVYSAYTNALSLFKAPNSAFSLLKARAYDTLRMNYLPVYLTYFDLTPTGAKRRCHKNIMYSFIAVSISKLRNSLIILTCAVHL